MLCAVIAQEIEMGVAKIIAAIKPAWVTDDLRESDCGPFSLSFI